MKFKDVSKNVNYAEIIEMAHVPEYNQFFKSIMDMIENSEMKEVIVEYERKREMYYKLLFEKNKQEYREHYFHWFELSRWREWDWSIILLKI